MFNWFKRKKSVVVLPEELRELIKTYYNEFVQAEQAEQEREDSRATLMAMKASQEAEEAESKKEAEAKAIVLNTEMCRKECYMAPKPGKRCRNTCVHFVASMASVVCNGYIFDTEYGRGTSVPYTATKPHCRLWRERSSMEGAVV